LLDVSKEIAAYEDRAKMPDNAKLSKKSNHTDLNQFDYNVYLVMLIMLILKKI